MNQSAIHNSGLLQRYDSAEFTELTVKDKHAAIQNIFQHNKPVGWVAIWREKLKQESHAITRKPHDAACYLPHPYSTWNFGTIPLEQVSASFQLVAKIQH